MGTLLNCAVLLQHAKWEKKKRNFGYYNAVLIVSFFQINGATELCV